MSTPMTADQFVAILRAEGVTVVEHRDWRNHNRNHKGPWGPVHGTVLHHTVSRGDSSIDLCYDGYSELPGPLCHGVITKDGRVHLVGNGRTNHAGGGDPNVLQAVIDERYNERPPVPQVGNATGVDGNRHFYGFECVNMGDGKDTWPEAQVEAMVRVSAAISRFYRWTEKSVIAHREWSRDKSDPSGPGMPSMPAMRERIKERLAHPASWSSSGAGTDTPQGPDMAIKPDRQRLTRTEDVVLLPGSPYTVYWTSEETDDGQQHGDGGKTMVTDRAYSTVVNVAITGLAGGERVEVFAVEEDANGDPFTSGVPSEIYGRAGGGPVRVSVPLMGVATQRLTIRVLSWAANVVTMTEARAASQYWPNV